ncbi:DNA polymerase III subunit delta [Teredinibacter waterburyi]|jgi:DNA polymerase III, delta subunit (EC 2.7.7.7)|uniref:DNA polymerase III subunit delta n=1 Tax=Teredinibacter waterburyi TaxID=1500538 RepID=UPI00165FADE5|nr:DNA polymerase III subunit delta [Teredinibacter waterburyi]
MARPRPEQLANATAKQLAPVYLITGDEPLVVQECCDIIRKSARAQGYTERELHHTDGGFSWDDLYHAASSLSLFADKKIIEIRVHNGKPGDAGSKALCDYCAHPAEDTLLLLVMPKLEKSAQNSKWYKAIDGSGDIVTVWPVGVQQLPRWVDQRLKAAGLNADSEAIDILCAKVEGNLLAAVQEIEKLKLLSDNNFIDAQLMSSAVMDSARYDIFGLVDKAISGDCRAAVATLHGLRSEGTEALPILWALSREVRALANIAEAQYHGESFDMACRRAGVWDKRKPLVKQALHRLKLRDLQMLQRKSALIDRSVKGAASSNPWSLLLDMVLTIAGVQVFSPRTQRMELRI